MPSARGSSNPEANLPYMRLAKASRFRFKLGCPTHFVVPRLTAYGFRTPLLKQKIGVYGPEKNRAFTRFTQPVEFSMLGMRKYPSRGRSNGRNANYSHSCGNTLCSARAPALWPGQLGKGIRSHKQSELNNVF